MDHDLIKTSRRLDAARTADLSVAIASVRSPVIATEGDSSNRSGQQTFSTGDQLFGSPGFSRRAEPGRHVGYGAPVGA